jgi:hypothetical protein
LQRLLSEATGVQPNPDSAAAQRDALPGKPADDAAG